MSHSVCAIVDCPYNNEACLEPDVWIDCEYFISQAEKQKPIEWVIFINPFAENLNFTSIEFVYIPPGTFMMGSPEDEPGRWEDETLHEVTLTKEFYMQTTQVTQRQWEAVMNNKMLPFTELDYPMKEVSWKDTQVFIKKLNLLEKNGTYRLPTEAEWEYACRAGMNTAYCFGNNPKKLREYAWFEENAAYRTHPVKRKKPNAWGLYDMHGNVWEWCQDLYEKETISRVLRGGSWYYGAGACRSANRGSNSSARRNDDYGFRLVFERVIRGGSWYDGTRGCRSALRACYSPDLLSDLIGFRLVFEKS